MNILKPQNLHFQKLENKCLIDLDEDEKINYCNFENEEYNNVENEDYEEENVEDVYQNLLINLEDHLVI